MDLRLGWRPGLGGEPPGGKAALWSPHLLGMERPSEPSVRSPLWRTHAWDMAARM